MDKKNLKKSRQQNRSRSHISFPFSPSCYLPQRGRHSQDSTWYTRTIAAAYASSPDRAPPLRLVDNPAQGGRGVARAPSVGIPPLYTPSRLSCAYVCYSPPKSPSKFNSCGSCQSSHQVLFRPSCNHVVLGGKNYVLAFSVINTRKG